MISGILPLLLLLLCGIYLTISGNFFQIKRFPDSVKLILKAFKNKKKNAEFSSFQAACTSLSATVGTGNIAGVAGALSIGGSGAIFWMIISAVAGMCIKAVEIVLAVKYRNECNGGFTGGPMYYIQKGMSPILKPLSVLFCIVGIPSVFCTGNITQTNAAVSSFGSNFTVRFISGVVFTLLVFAIINGGIKRIGVITEKIVPLMSFMYIILSLSVIILNIDFLPTAFKMIIVGAFTPKAVTGGAVGSVITCALIGAERGVFSNEAGLGTSAMAHSSAFDADCRTQGLFGIFEVFVDTIVLCTLTALTILCSGIEIDYGKISSSELVISALGQLYGKISAPIISVMLCLFAFSSIVGWAVYGCICTNYLFGKKGEKIFLYLYPLGSVLGAVCNVKLAWDLSAFFNGIMLLINLPVILTLSGEALKYFNKEEKGNVRKKNYKNKRIFAKRYSGYYNKR